MLCIPYSLPSYVRTALKHDGLILQTDFRRDTAGPRSPGIHRRIFFDNSLELRFTSTQQHLLVEAHYHHHPWLRPADGAATDLLVSLSLNWHGILDASLSAHARMDWIASLPEDPIPLGMANCHDASGRDLMKIEDGPVTCMVSRPPGAGLFISFSPDGQALYPVQMAPGRCATALRNALITSARATDDRIRELPFWRRAALLASKRLSMIAGAFRGPKHEG